MRSYSMREHMSSHPPERQIDIAIPLTKGKVAFISRKDADLAEYYWYFNAQEGYAQRTVGGKMNRRKVFLHREIAQTLLDRPLTSTNFIVPRDGDPLNNRRENLECITMSERNQRIK